MSDKTTKGKVLEREGSIFLGNSIRTTNKDEMNGEGGIPQLWDDFYQNKVLDTIPNKKDSKILAVYTDYETDENGVYTFALGTEVDHNETLNGLEMIEIPEGKYIVFTTKRGPIPDVIVETWQEIWKWSEEYERAYQTDFELYDERAKDPNNSQVDIYISVK
ncbi:GyrI-like domain-containing protein [Rossellomorea sp. NPDC077527]|uniref:GyrI-like domain-containing protein n=1 Tax=Rossellomorea sp. NPDC077527 TaxID=3364510 RepID=UPI0037C55671